MIIIIIIINCHFGTHMQLTEDCHKDVRGNETETVQKQSGFQQLSKIIELNQNYASEPACHSGSEARRPEGTRSKL